MDPQLVGVGKAWKANIVADEALGEADELDDEALGEVDELDDDIVDALALRVACDPSMKQEATKSTA